MDKAARAAWVKEIMAKHAKRFQTRGLKPDPCVDLRAHWRTIEIYGTSPNCTFLVVRMDFVETPPALIALMEAARDIPYEGRRPDEFIGIAVYLDGTMRVTSYACNNRDPVYYPEDVEKRILSQFP